MFFITIKETWKLQRYTDYLIKNKEKHFFIPILLLTFAAVSGGEIPELQEQ